MECNKSRPYLIQKSVGHYLKLKEALQLEGIIYLSTIVLPLVSLFYAATSMDEDSVGGELTEQFVIDLFKIVFVVKCSLV